jgi:Protein of unknown function (DUF1579)
VKQKLLAVTVASLLFAAAVAAQMQHRTPAPELKKLDYFAGTWKVDADMKPSPLGPGGKMTGTDRVEWMQGNFFMVIHSTFSSQTMGSGVGYGFLGYDPKKKEYTYEAFDSDGEHETATGTVDADGKVWTWNSSGNGMPAMKSRYIETVLSPDSYEIKFEMSQDGNNWSSVMQGKATKQ